MTDDIEIQRGSGNVFRDLGTPDPELRQRASCHTVQALVDGVCTAEAPGQPRPQVQPEGDNAVRVAVAPCAQADALAARLREVLAPLPLTVRITTAPAAGSPQNA